MGSTSSGCCVSPGSAYHVLLTWNRHQEIKISSTTYSSQPQHGSGVIREDCLQLTAWSGVIREVLVYWGVTPQQQPGSYQGGEMMMMKSVFWWWFSECRRSSDLKKLT